MRKANVNIRRKEVDVNINGCDSEEGNGIEIGDYDFPDPQSLAAKYGLVIGLKKILLFAI